MEQRLSLVTLAVSDLLRSRRFYEQGLGWTPAFVGDDVAFYQLPGMVLGLWARASMAADLGVSESELGSGAIQLAHNVRDRETVEATLRSAQAAGARVSRPAHEAPWGGYTGMFTDPDGHPWEVAWNPEWMLGPDGTVRLP